MLGTMIIGSAFTENGQWLAILQAIQPRLDQFEIELAIQVGEVQAFTMGPSDFDGALARYNEARKPSSVVEIRLTFEANRAIATHGAAVRALKDAIEAIEGLEVVTRVTSSAYGAPAQQIQLVA